MRPLRSPCSKRLARTMNAECPRAALRSFLLALSMCRPCAARSWLCRHRTAARTLPRLPCWGHEGRVLARRGRGGRGEGEGQGGGDGEAGEAGHLPLPSADTGDPGPPVRAWTVGRVGVPRARRRRAALESSGTGCSSAWLERCVWDAEVAGSNPATPIRPPRSRSGRRPPTAPGPYRPPGVSRRAAASAGSRRAGGRRPWARRPRGSGRSSARGARVE